MILHIGERVYWGAPEVIYLEGSISALDEQAQTVAVHIERATPHSAHLIGEDLPFAASGVTPLKGASPPGTTNKHSDEHLPSPMINDEEKIHRAAAVAVHQQYGYSLPPEQEQILITQVFETLNNDTAMRTRIITTMDEILRREW